MEEKFDWIANVSGGLSDVTDSHTGTNYIDVLNHADGFRIYLKDIQDTEKEYLYLASVWVTLAVIL